MSDNKNNTAEINLPQHSELSPEWVKDYLLANPDFFNRYPILVEELNIPHDQRGAVSLVELQSQQLRGKVQELQGKISQLMSVAKQNERIYRIYADLNLALFNCRSMKEILAALNKSICDELNLQAVSLKLFSGEDAFPEAQKQHFITHRLKQKDFFFGRMTQEETEQLFPDTNVSSVAIMLLKHETEVGLLVIGSYEEDHFHPDMDTLLIQQLQQMLSLLLPKILAD